MQIFKTIVTYLAILATMVNVVVSKPLEISKALQKSVPPTSDDIQSIINTHNNFRANHDAPALTWDQELADFSYSWASKCSISHSGAKYGENIAGRTKTWSNTVDAWYSEVANYDYSKPGFAISSGHFTQVVWKNTKTVGCASAYCDNIKGIYYVCEYYPRGNVIYGGSDPAVFFKTNVTSKV